MISDWSDEKNYLIHYSMLKFYIRHGMIVDKVNEMISFRHSRWLEKNINFNTRKRNEAITDFERGFYKLLNNAFYGNRLKIKSIKKDEYREILKSNLN